VARRRIRRGRHNWNLWLQLLKIVVILGVVGAVIVYTYLAGRREAGAELETLNQSVARLTTQNATDKDAIAHLSSDLAVARKRADTLQAQYDALAPSDDIKTLIPLLRTRLDAGLPVKRLAFVIGQAQMPRNCSDNPQKHVRVAIPGDDGSDTVIRYAGLISLSVDGMAVSGGKWFDPHQPVRVHFQSPEGKDEVAEGILPLQYTLVVKGKEYHFSVVAAAHGFVDVNSDRCDYAN